MPNEPIDFLLVRDRGTGAKKYIPRSKYEAQKELWAQVGGGKSVSAAEAPAYESPVVEGGSKSGQQAATPKEK